MQTTKVAISAFVDGRIHEALKEIAENEGRSLTKQITHVLSKYAEAHLDDGA